MKYLLFILIVIQIHNNFGSPVPEFDIGVPPAVGLTPLTPIVAPPLYADPFFGLINSMNLFEPLPIKPTETEAPEPLPQVPQPEFVDEGIPRLGTGPKDPNVIATLQALKSVLEGMLG